MWTHKKMYSYKIMTLNSDFNYCTEPKKEKSLTRVQVALNFNLKQKATETKNSKTARFKTYA